MTKSCMENDAELCMKCGFCMSVCPVYRADQVESHVARGRNTLINWAEKGMIESDKSFREALSFCILCHRCEQICPAGVPSTAITLKAREKAVKQHGLPLIQRLAYQGVLKHRSFMAKILETVSRLYGLFDKKAIPIRHLADIYSLLSKGFYVPPLSNPFLSRLLPERISPPKEIKPKGEVAFFPGCAFEFFFADIGRKTIEVIVNAGFEVVYPHGLSCCGLGGSFGISHRQESLAIQKKKMDAIQDSGAQAVITSCPGCMIQLMDGVRRYGMDTRVLHISELMHDKQGLTTP